ncbi:MAG: hypothetical protein SAJ12_22540 [Jaaginema sp. PMC 1079.18]|nr:hypothetical protein [Jaaginema sp. PMC 1080.18]MEC4853768.1 hypothetical protein [Jaaginema sp. PMC 1079.18]MEC4864613.1 hypothetical protein [Jaaginema sp. PMC 1078.18]
MSLKNKSDANYDPHLTAAETGARQEREKENFKERPDKEGSIDTEGGMTVDREGLANNYAIEPEMYVEEPGDLRKSEAELQQEREQELEEVNRSGGKGPGVI